MAGMKGLQKALPNSGEYIKRKRICMTIKFNRKTKKKF